MSKGGSSWDEMHWASGDRDKAFIIFKSLLFCLFCLLVLGLRCCAGYSLGGRRSYSLVVLCNLFMWWLRAAEQFLGTPASVVVAPCLLEHRLNCCDARVLGALWLVRLPKSGWNPYLLHRQVDCLPLSHEGEIWAIFEISWPWGERENPRYMDDNILLGGSGR